MNDLTPQSPYMTRILLGLAVLWKVVLRWETNVLWYRGRGRGRGGQSHQGDGENVLIEGVVISSPSWSPNTDTELILNTQEELLSEIV